MRRVLILAALLISGSFSVLQADDLTPGSIAYTVPLASVPDPDLVGKKVDVMSRMITSNRAVAPLEKDLLNDVLLLSIPGQSTPERSAVLALTPTQVKKLEKVSQRAGIDLVIRRR
jgi:hypothetical protein